MTKWAILQIRSILSGLTGNPEIEPDAEGTVGFALVCCLTL